MKNDLTTEQKIKAAAREVFIAKGFAACSTREIAKVSGMNVALVNYYFRSKTELFKLVFQDAMEEFVNSMVEVFSSDKSLEDKIRLLIEQEYEFLSRHPELPGFIVNELHREEGYEVDGSYFEKLLNTGIVEECQRACAAGKMREIDLISLTLLIMSNCDFPFMSKNLMKGIHKLSNDAYENQLNTHKKIVTDMLVSYLFPQKSI
ncbi:MAG: TetR/AcrR family transcriptional regulator [Flavobacteriales bacterium]|nr:TetR/AcrR family transcriptional regulator [Flavobacteriales bacterium]